MNKVLGFILRKRRIVISAAGNENNGVTRNVIPESRQVVDCCICLDVLITEDNLRCVSTPCGHKFHSRCLLNWFERDGMSGSRHHCPMCRQAVSEQDLIPWAAKRTELSAVVNLMTKLQQQKRQQDNESRRWEQRRRLWEEQQNQWLARRQQWQDDRRLWKEEKRGFLGQRRLSEEREIQWEERQKQLEDLSLNLEESNGQLEERNRQLLCKLRHSEEISKELKELNCHLAEERRQLADHCQKQQEELNKWRQEEALNYRRHQAQAQYCSSRQQDGQGLNPRSQYRQVLQETATSVGKRVNSQRIVGKKLESQWPREADYRRNRLQQEGQVQYHRPQCQRSPETKFAGSRANFQRILDDMAESQRQQAKFWSLLQQENQQCDQCPNDSHEAQQI